MRVTVAVEIPALALWRAESGGGGDGEEIGVIALLLVVCVSGIAAAASTNVGKEYEEDGHCDSARELHVVMCGKEAQDALLE